MLHLILAVALHLGGDFQPHDNSGSATYCGAGTNSTPDSNGNTACVAASPAFAPAAQPASAPAPAPVAAAPTIVAAPTVVTQPLYTVGYGYGGFGRGWGGWHHHTTTTTTSGS